MVSLSTNIHHASHNQANGLEESPMRVFALGTSLSNGNPGGHFINSQAGKKSANVLANEQGGIGSPADHVSVTDPAGFNSFNWGWGKHHSSGGDRSLNSSPESSFSTQKQEEQQEALDLNIQKLFSQLTLLVWLVIEMALKLVQKALEASSHAIIKEEAFLGHQPEKKELVPETNLFAQADVTHIKKSRFHLGPV